MNDEEKIEKGNAIHRTMLRLGWTPEQFKNQSEILDLLFMEAYLMGKNGGKSEDEKKMVLGL